MAESSAPPYEGVMMPDRFRDVAYDDLPAGIKQKIRWKEQEDDSATP